MANALVNIAGVAAAAYMGNKKRKSEFNQANQWRAKYGIEEVPWEDSPLDNAVSWVGGKLKSLAPDAGAPLADAVAPVGEAPIAADDDVTLWERLKAGNIDQEGSEAYQRWGKGKSEGAQRVADLDQSSRLEAAQSYEDSWDEASAMPDELLPTE